MMVILMEKATRAHYLKVVVSLRSKAVIFGK